MKYPTWRSSLLVGVCGIGFTIAAIVGALAILIVANRGVHHQFHETFDVFIRTDLARLPGNVFSNHLTGTAELEDLPAWLFYLCFCRTLAVTIVGLFGLWQVWMLARDIEVEESFTAINARRLRIVGLIVLVGLPLRSIVGTALTKAALAAQVPPERGITAFSGLGYGSFIAALVILVLAELFGRAARLRADLEGTV